MILVKQFTILYQKEFFIHPHFYILFKKIQIFFIFDFIFFYFFNIIFYLLYLSIKNI